MICTNLCVAVFGAYADADIHQRPASLFYIYNKSWETEINDTLLIRPTLWVTTIFEWFRPNAMTSWNEKKKPWKWVTCLAISIKCLQRQQVNHDSVATFISRSFLAGFVAHLSTRHTYIFQQLSKSSCEFIVAFHFSFSICMMRVCVCVCESPSLVCP